MLGLQEKAQSNSDDNVTKSGEALVQCTGNLHETKMRKGPGKENQKVGLTVKKCPSIAETW